MKINYILILAILCFISSTSCQKNKIKSKNEVLEEHIDSLFQTSIQNKEIAGASILVFRKDTILIKKSYGMASLELSTPMPENGQFEIGSVTKQFTAAAILKLAEKGKLSLEDDFTEYLKFDTKGRKVTIKNLLNHTSGIVSYTEIPEFWELAMEDHPRDTLVTIVEKNGFLFEPNEASIYNNSAYFFLGLIIENVTGQSYEDYLKQIFFDPLNMTNTMYCTDKIIVENKVYGYNHDNGKLQPKSFLNHKWPYSGGSLCSTAEDLKKWLLAIHDGKVLSSKYYSEMIIPDTLNDGTRLNYASGLVNFENNGRKEISHSGYINGFLSDTKYFPEDDLYVICLLNTTGPKSPNYFANEVIWKILDKKTTKRQDFKTDLKELMGRYSGKARNGNQIMNVEVKNKVLLVREENSSFTDSIDQYIGENTWKKGNSLIVVKNGEYRVNDRYNYYILYKNHD